MLSHNNLNAAHTHAPPAPEIGTRPVFLSVYAPKSGFKES
jgi:hypothetical protein